MNTIRHLAAATAILFALSGAADAHAAADAPRSRAALAPLRLGIDYNPPDERPVSDLVDLHARGLNHYLVPLTWSVLEPSPGQYDFTYVDIGRLLPGLGFELALWVAPVETTLRQVPADLGDRQFDDPAVKARFRRLLRAVLDRAGGTVRSVYLGSEVDIYFSSHRDELGPYLRLVGDAAAFVHRAYPGVRIGISTTLLAVDQEQSIARAVNRHTDFFAASYYPEASRPLQVRSDLERIRALAGRKPVFFEQVGFPSSPVTGSSEAKQAAFFRRFFATILERPLRRPRILGANIDWLYEQSETACSDFEDRYGFHDPVFHAFLCSLGLHRSDGSAKPALRVVFDAAARARRRPS